MSESDIRVIQHQKTIEFDEGVTCSTYEYVIQYRNKATKGMWCSVPVIKIKDDLERYQRLKDGSYE